MSTSENLKALDLANNEKHNEELAALIIAMQKEIKEKEELLEENKRLNLEINEMVKLYNELKENINKLKEVFLNM